MHLVVEATYVNFTHPPKN